MWLLNDVPFLLFTTDAQAFQSAQFGQGVGPIYLDAVACSGTETDIFECSASAMPAPSCDHSQDASVRCNFPRALLKYCISFIYTHALDTHTHK